MKNASDAEIIRRHYKLSYAVSDADVAKERASLERKNLQGTMDDSDEKLFIALGMDKVNYREKW